MSLKKMCAIGLLSLFSTSVLSKQVHNSTSTMSSFAEKAKGLYVGVNAGWSQLDWKNQLGTASQGASWNYAANNGSFIAGLDLGYSFNSYLAVELGGFWSPTNVKYNDNVVDSTDTFKTWDLYLAAKVAVPVYEKLSLFGKLGLAYAHTNVSNAAAFAFPGTVATGNHGTFRPLFAAGLGYDFAQNWNANAQYAFILGRQSNGETYSPNQNMYTFGVSYSFAL